MKKQRMDKPSGLELSRFTNDVLVDRLAHREEWKELYIRETLRRLNGVDDVQRVEPREERTVVRHLDSHPDIRREYRRCFGEDTSHSMADMAQKVLDSHWDRIDPLQSDKKMSKSSYEVDGILKDIVYMSKSVDDFHESGKNLARMIFDAYCRWCQKETQ